MPHSLFPVLLAAAGLALPAAASAEAPPFAARALPDTDLARVHGTGFVRQASLQRAARDDFEAFGRVTAVTLPVTFDNWFNDVGAVLIVSNLLR